MRILLISFFLIWSAKAAAIDLVGTTDFSQIIAINSSLSARVEKIHVDQGQRVKKGDLLISLNSSLFKARVDAAKAGVATVLPRLAQMQDELDKANELYDRDSLALIALNIAEQNFQSASAEVSAAEARLQIAQIRLSETEIRSPINGNVFSIDTHPQRYINQRVSDPELITLVDNREMIVTALLPAEHWGEKLLAKPATLSYQGKTFLGKVVATGLSEVSGKNNHPALELKLLFLTNGKIPANAVIAIQLDDN